MNRLDGKLALVTGAGSGIGAGIARRFHAEGAQLIINDLRREAAEATAKEVDRDAIVADVSDSAGVAGMFAQVAERYGRLDILVNNAGFYLHSEAHVSEMLETAGKQAAELQEHGQIKTHWDFTLNLSDAAWHRMIGVHVNGTFFCSREALRIMSPQNSGVIINMGSIQGSNGTAGAIDYCTAKAAIMGFTRSLAKELASRNIRVNSLAPGFVETEGTEPIRAIFSHVAAGTPLRRLGQPDDIAWAAVYLASEESSFVTGQVLSPNGGIYVSQ